MLWMITADHMETNRVGRCNDDLATSLDSAIVPIGRRLEIVAECDYEFRLYDDDDNLCYEGACCALDQQDGDSAFEPLDWAEGMVGATRMDYRKKGDTEWSTL